MKEEIVTTPLKCPFCSEDDIKFEDYVFRCEIKEQDIQVKLSCYVCQSSKQPILDSRQMNKLRKESADEFKKKNNLLSSKEIVIYRKRLGMSQQTFADYLKVGVASVKRWETYYIQDASQDDHIRLKCDLEIAKKNAEYLESLSWRKALY